MSLQARLARHWPRLMLALLWAVGGEVLAWSFPTDRPLLDWALILLGYVALAYALADLAVRWRLRDLYGTAALGGVAALIYSLLMYPAFALEDIPRTLVTRALGSYGLILMGMLLLWLLVLDRLPLRRLALPVAALMGLCWGVWVRHAPALTAIPAPAIDTDTFSLIGAALAVGLVLAAWIGSRQAATSPQSLLLSPHEAVFCLAVMTATLYRQFDLDTLDMVARGVVVGLIGLALSMMWFRKDSTRTYFDTPVRVAPHWPVLLGALIAFLIAASVAFGLPLPEAAFSPLDAVVLLFGLFGLTWLPGVGVILGLRAILREASATQL